ncbi:phage tail tape measure protein [Desulfarculus baarsii]
MDKTLLFRFALHGQAQAAAAFGGLAQEAQRLRGQVEQADRAAGRVGGQQRLRAMLGGLRQSAAGAGQAALTAGRDFAASARQLGQNAIAATRAAKATRQLAREQAAAANQAQRLSQKERALQQVQAARAQRQAAMGGLGGVAGGLLGGVAAGAAVAAPVVKAIDFESAMADVKKVMNFSAPDGLEKLGQDLLRLSAVKIPLSGEQLAAIAAAGGQLGVKEKDILAFVQTTSKMAVAWDMSAEAAGEASAKLSNVWDIPIERVEALGDAINHLSDNTAAKAPEMINVLTRVGGMGKQFGLSAVQTAALGNAFLALGRPPEVAATGINTLLNKLQTADKQGEKFQQGLAAIGLDAQGLKDAIQNDAQGALLGFLEAVEGLDPSERAGVLMDMFGLEYADDLAILVGGLDKYKQALKLTGKQADYLGSMTREFENRSATTANQLQLLGNKLSRLAINAGTVLLPVIGALVGAAGWVLDLLADFQEAFPIVSGAISGVVVGGLALVTAWKLGAAVGGYLVGGVKEMVATLRLLRSSQLAARLATRLQTLALARQKAVSMALAAKQWLIVAVSKAWAVAQGLVNAAMWANPITWVVAGVVALAAGAYLLIKYWDQVANFFGWLWGWIKAGAAAVWDWLKATALAPVEWIKSAWSTVSGFFGGLWRGLETGASAAWGMVKATALAPVEWIKSAWSAVSGFFGGLWRGLEAGASAAWGMVKATVLAPIEWIKSAWSAVSGFFGGLWDGVKAGAAVATAGIRAAFASALDWLRGTSLYQAGAKLIGAFVEGIKASVGQPIEAVKSLLAQVRQYLPFSDAKRGPLSTLTLSGQAFAGTFAAGIGQGSGPLIQAVAGLAQSAWSGLQGAAGAAAEFLGLGGPSGGLAKAQGELNAARGQAQGPAVAAPAQITIHQTINASGADKAGLKTTLDQANAELTRLIERTVNEMWARNQRTSMGNVGA